MELEVNDVVYSGTISCFVVSVSVAGRLQLVEFEHYLT